MLKIIFFGTPQFAVPTLNLLLENPNFEVKGVVTQPDKKRGRGNEMLPSDVKKVALNHNLPIWQPINIKKDQETINQLKEVKADAFVVVAYGQILSRKILNLPRLGCINLHGSILPKYRGAAPIQWCLYDGENITGNTTMLMDRGMDTGAMLLQDQLSINILDNADQIGEKLSYNGANLMLETLLKLDKNEVKPIAQDHNLATYASLINKSDYELNWQRSALELHNQVRAFYPHCVSYFREKQVKIMQTIPLNQIILDQLSQEYQSLKQQFSDLTQLNGEVGEIVAIIKKWGAIIKTGADYLLLKEVQLSGKKVQSGWDFVNGCHLKIGEKFVTMDS